MESEFKVLLQKAKQGEKKAKLEIIEIYRPLMLKSAFVGGRFDEDLYQEYIYTILLCIRKFPMDNIKCLGQGEAEEEDFDKAGWQEAASGYHNQ